VFGGQAVHNIFYKDQLVFQSASQDEIENWLSEKAMIPAKASMPTTIAEAIARVFSNRRST
jgi:hypothetical protein